MSFVLTISHLPLAEPRHVCMDPAACLCGPALAPAPGQPEAAQRAHRRKQSTPQKRLDTVRALEVKLAAQRVRY
jgi:hypothetical protein